MREYEIINGVELPGWPGLAGVESLVGPVEQTLEAVYYDTEDLRLARAGVTVRRRPGADDAGWHLTLPKGRDSRTRRAMLAPIRPRPIIPSCGGAAR
jgi:hypothetical protein